MRILILSHSHPDFTTGGGEHAAYNLFCELNSRSELHAVFLGFGGSHSPHAGSAFATHTANGQEIIFYSANYDWFLFSQQESNKVSQNFRSLLETYKPDIIHFQHYAQLGLELIREARNYSHQVPIILTLHEFLPICAHNGQMVTTNGFELCDFATPIKCHNCFPDRSAADFKRRELFIKSFFNLVDCLISPSHFLTDRFVQWGIPSEKILFVENGQPLIEATPPRPLKPGGTRNHFAFFGQFTPYKGVLLLLEALQYLPPELASGFSLAIHGGANLKHCTESYQEQFQVLLKKVNHLAHYHGKYKPNDLPALIADIDWVVVPSTWWENSPLVIQEAFRHGRPVICSDIGGMAEKVENYKSGLHFRVGDPRRLAEKLAEASTQTDLWEKLRIGITPPITVAESCDQHLRIYHLLIKQKQSASIDLKFSGYQIKLPAHTRNNRPRILHAIANFMTGGSSRLVVDLIEHLGDQYDQSILTSFIPDPPAYVGAGIHEIRGHDEFQAIKAYMTQQKPDLVHVHYWGDWDEPWYRQVFIAAEQLGYPVLENINTPVAPYISPNVTRYVYVSKYVLDNFGQSDENSSVIYPGSDFSLFLREDLDQIPDNCIGMVYRLEPDKLNDTAIDPLIRAVQCHPDTHAMIVGGGSLEPIFKYKVEVAGVAHRFTFTGYVNYERLTLFYRQFTLFVAPVWKESFGQVSPFAMSMGLPVVGYRIGGLAEIVDDESLLAPPGDSEALAEIIVRLLEDRPRRMMIGRRNQERAHRYFSVEAMVAAYRTVYAEILGV